MTENNDQVPATLGERVQALRAKAALTQEDLAAAIGVRRSTIAMIETGGDLPGRETLVAIADFFGVTADFLVKGGDPTAQPPEKPKLVDDPDELALLALWGDLDEGERRFFLKLLRPPTPP